MIRVRATDKISRSRIVAQPLSAVWILLVSLSLPRAVTAQTPALTTINDTVYRADGTTATGTVLISWPSFQTMQGDAVVAGNLSVTLGVAGSFTAQLVPNIGATPTGTFYVVVYQLDDGTVRTQYWAVPPTSPTSISAVLTQPGNGLNNQAITQDYVNNAIAGRALDSAVVHLAGAETIVGVKQFAAAPALPAPVGGNDGANKSYVDAAVANVGAGSFVAKAGDTMSGPLNLPGDPSAPNQAADRHYVDTGLSGKADLVGGAVPPAELGAGVANATTCLIGNSTWGLCGGGAPAGITYATTALNWAQTVSGALTSGVTATVTLTPCPTGIDTTSGAGYQVLLTGGGNSETAAVTTAAGGCTSGSTTGTISFTPALSYPSGYTISSASSGLQETLNAACGVGSTTFNNSQCNVTIPANGPGSSVNTYNVYGTIYLHANQSVLSGYGVSLNCLGRGACLQVGDLRNSNDYTNTTVMGLSFRSPVNMSSNPSFAGVGITQTQKISQVVTVTTGTAHGFRVGDMVTILFTDSSAYWGDAVITAVPSATTFQYAHPGTDLAAQATPGVVALAYVAVLDNGLNVRLADISYDKVGENGHFNNFFDLWDDENATITHFNNNAISLNANANWTGSFVFSAGNQAQQIAPVITLRDSTITANYSNGVTVYNSNGVYVENTVLQATGPWQVYSANTTGNFQGAYLKNIYSESTTALNPASPARSPYAGLGIAGLIAGTSSGAATFEIAGNGGVAGAFAAGGAGSTPYTYFVVVNDTTTGTQSSPLQVMNWLSTGSDSIAVKWPRVANGTDAMTYDVLRMTTPVGVGGVYPYAGGCGGGASGACGYVARGLTQAAACSGGLICTYTDSGSSTTAAYTIKQGNYAGALPFWPGGIVAVNRGVSVDAEQANVVGVGLAGTPLQVAKQCSGNGVASPGGYTACASTVTLVGNSVANQPATILGDGPANGGANQSLSKGRLNFGTTAYTAMLPHHMITLIDSQPALTQATTGYRPAANANDVWIGTDVASAGVALNLGQLAFGAPVSITNYIGATGDGVSNNWLERLTTNLREFKVPVKFDQSVTITGLANGCLNVTAGAIASTGTACGSGSGGSVNSVFGRTGTVVAGAGDYSVSQVTGAAADAAVMHNTGTETVAGAKTFSGLLTASANLVLPQGSAFVPAPGGIGLDTAAGLPVVNIAGTSHQVAFTSSNISGQSGTTLALAATPTQCSGAFATGIAANGNANCTTPNVIQLSETTQPTGIPNWGVFWFDSATHSPRVIDNNGQVTQLGFTNLFNTDPGGDPADNLEERNGTTAQSLRVYSNFVSNTNWQRTSLGFDATDNYAVIRSENSTSSSAPGLGLWVGSGLKWVIDATGNLKPWTDNLLNVGSDSGNGVKSVFAKTSFNSVVFGRNDFEIPNDSANGTVVNELAVFNSASPSQAIVSATSSTNGVIGIVQGNAGKTGNAVVTWRGYAFCIFDNSTTAGDAVTASTSSGGKCHDTGSSSQPAAQLIGYVDVTNATSGQTNGVRVALEAPQGGGSGAVASVFGRTGTVAAANGDYSVAQVTGAAADSSVVHLSGTETITGAKTFSSNVTLNGNLSVAGNISQTGTGPTQWSGQQWTGTTVTVPNGLGFSLGVGSDNAFLCQLASGGSCMPTPACSWVTMPTQGGSGNAFSGTNKALVWGVYNPYPCLSSNVAYVVGTADNTANNYALGMYSGASAGSGTLIATTASTAGTSFASSTGIKHIAWNASSVTVPAGRVYIALTSSCASACAALLGSPGSGVTWAANLQVAVTTGGAALPATVTLPADSFSSGASIPALIVY